WWAAWPGPAGKSRRAGHNATRSTTPSERAPHFGNAGIPLSSPRCGDTYPEVPRPHPDVRPRYVPAARLCPGSTALRDDGQRQLAGGLVDHLAVQHDRSAPVDPRGPLVGVDDPHRPSVLVRGRGERLVDDLDLARMQHPLAVVAQRGGAVR